SNSLPSYLEIKKKTDNAESLESLFEGCMQILMRKSSISSLKVMISEATKYITQIVWKIQKLLDTKSLIHFGNYLDYCSVDSSFYSDLSENSEVDESKINSLAVIRLARCLYMAYLSCSKGKASENSSKQKDQLKPLIFIVDNAQINPKSTKSLVVGVNFSEKANFGKK
ncbi:MAG: hypothetical protein MHPSP_001777, partial [Paramarteilia canceri]